MNYYIYSVAECNLSVTKHVDSKSTAAEAIGRAKELREQWRTQTGRTPYRYVVRYNPSNALVASIP